MMQSMRDKTQGIIAGVIAILIAITFVLWGVQNYLGSGKSNIAAEVNGKEITKEQLRLVYEQTKRMQMLQSNSNFFLNQKAQTALKEKILKDLIEGEIIYQAETKMGLGVSHNQLLVMIGSLPIFQVNGAFSRDRFQQLVSRVYRSEQEFFSEIERSTLKVQLEKAIKDSEFMLSSEIKNINDILKQRRDFSYFKLSPQRFLKNIKVSDAEIKQYYEEHQKEFLLPEKISIQYLELASGDFKSSIKPTNKDYQAFYYSHMDSFSSPKKWQVIKAVVPLSMQADQKRVGDANKRINKIAEQLKTQKKLKDMDNGVIVNTVWLSRNELSPELFNRLNKLNVSDISTPFRSRDGYTLFKVLAIKQPVAEPYNQVKGKVKQLYNRAEITRVFTEASDKLADLVYTNTDSLRPAADELLLKVKETGFFTIDGSKKGLLADSRVVKTSFSDAVLKQRYNSGLIELEPGRIVVLRVKEHIPESTQPLSRVKSEILRKIKSKKAHDKMVAFGKEILHKFLSGESERQLVTNYSLSWKKVLDAEYSDTDKLIEAVFSLFKPEGDKIAVNLVELDDGYAIVRLDKVYSVAINKNSVAEKEFIKSLPKTLGDFEYSTLLDYLKSQAKIIIFEDK